MNSNAANETRNPIAKRQAVNRYFRWASTKWSGVQWTRMWTRLAC